jgi:hypothetical protein
MRKLFLILVVLAAAFVGLGFYLEWFRIGTSTNPETGETEVKFGINSNKMKEDAAKAKQKVAGKDKQKDAPAATQDQEKP